jgi:transposase-like protein
MMGKRGRKPKYDLSNEACPNPQCEFFGKQGQGNIVSNGSHAGQGGRRVRKLRCKQCGESFCERSGTIFYDLRSSEEKVLMALKLLVKGMPLRGVAEVMGVKLDTVRHWLRVAAEHSEQVNALLVKELKVGQVELDALWSFVKKNDLRHRAGIWREKSGSGSPWLRSIG